MPESRAADSPSPNNRRPARDQWGDTPTAWMATGRSRSAAARNAAAIFLGKLRSLSAKIPPPPITIASASASRERQRGISRRPTRRSSIRPATICRSDPGNAARIASAATRMPRVPAPVCGASRPARSSVTTVAAASAARSSAARHSAISWSPRLAPCRTLKTTIFIGVCLAQACHETARAIREVPRQSFCMPDRLWPCAQCLSRGRRTLCVKPLDALQDATAAHAAAGPGCLCLFACKRCPCRINLLLT